MYKTGYAYELLFFIIKKKKNNRKTKHKSNNAAQMPDHYSAGNENDHINLHTNTIFCFKNQCLKQ